MANKDEVVTAAACPLCGDTRATVLSRRGRSGRPLRTVACVNCGLVRSDPRPHDVRRFYEDDYRLAYKGTFAPRRKHVVRAGLVALARLQAIAPHLHGRMRVLDVGSGGGEFAYLLQRAGHDVRGIEPNRGYAEYASREYGLDIARGFVGDAPLADAEFDLITIWHVLEHTEDPAAVLAKLGRALRPGGTLVVEVPNVEATCQSPRSTFHEAHLYDFNIATLERMAMKAGLRPVTSGLSDDGGNITAVFHPDVASAGAERDWSLPGNHQRVAAIVRGHTRLRHWLSPHPYRRALRRLRRMLAERRATRGDASGRQLLDALYARALGEQPAVEALAATRPVL